MCTSRRDWAVSTVTAESDVHGGASRVTPPSGENRQSLRARPTSIECESCHGGVDGYARTVPCETYTGAIAECAADRRGNALRNVVVDSNGNYFLTGRVDGKKHYVVQTVDTIVDNGKINPTTGYRIYSPAASYAMGRADGNPETGVGPTQLDGSKVGSGFAHSDTMECVSCHSSWSNNCLGCHASNEYNDDPNTFLFSNITGERIVLAQNIADFVYISPVPMALGVGSSGRITNSEPGMKMFLRYTDHNGVESDTFSFTDRLGNGNNPNVQGRGKAGALAHNKIMSHTIRGKVTPDKEGPRYCVACHLTTDSVSTYGNAYQQFRTAMSEGNYEDLNFDLLAEHIGKNPGNQKNSPFWVHMVVGLGSGLFLFDDKGCPVNPLDTSPNRQGCNNVAPDDVFDGERVLYNLDRIVEESGVANASNSHPMRSGLPSPLRDGALHPEMAGPLGKRLIQRLADPVNGLVLDSWFDADRSARGRASTYQ